MGKWIAFVVAVAAALIAFLVFRRKAAAAMSGRSNPSRAPGGATAGGALATLTAPPKPEGTPNNTPVIAPPRDIRYTPATGIAGFSSIGRGPSEGLLLRPVTSTLPTVGTGTVVPSKPATQAMPTPFTIPPVSYGQSYYVTPPPPPPPAPAPAPSPALKSTYTSGGFTRSF